MHYSSRDNNQQYPENHFHACIEESKARSPETDDQYRKYEDYHLKDTDDARNGLDDVANFFRAG